MASKNIISDVAYIDFIFTHHHRTFKVSVTVNYFDGFDARFKIYAVHAINSDGTTHKLTGESYNDVKDIYRNNYHEDTYRTPLLNELQKYTA